MHVIHFLINLLYLLVHRQKVLNISTHHAWISIYSAETCIESQAIEPDLKDLAWG